VKTQILIDGREIQLEWTLEGETCRFRRESEPERTADVRQIAPGVWSIIVEGCVYEAMVEQGSVRIGGRTYPAEIVDPRRWDPGRRSGAGHGQQRISAPMPGKIVRVLVAEGDAVEAGQGLVVVEAMKMQNEMKAARPGRVARITVSPGAAVGAGDVLVTIE
jgi:biotin carboxyl carrier protein